EGPTFAGGARCACGASWTIYWGGLTALLARPRSGLSTAGHASPHDHAPSAFKAQPCFAPRRPGTPVSGELLALQRIVVSFTDVPKSQTLIPLKSQKTDGYCWRTQKCRNWCVPHAFLEGKKAWETCSRKGTPRTLKYIRQQYRDVFACPS